MGRPWFIEARGKSGPRHWRFSLRSLVVTIALVSVFMAITLSGAQTKEIARTGIYARHFGWPIAYLRVPAREHSGKVPADLFVPGLLIDIAIFGVAVGAGRLVWRRMRHLSKQDRSGD